MATKPLGQVVTFCIGLLPEKSSRLKFVWITSKRLGRGTIQILCQLVDPKGNGTVGFNLLAAAGRPEYPNNLHSYFWIVRAALLAYG
jgi:hypothetical protein